MFCGQKVAIRVNQSLDDILILSQALIKQLTVDQTKARVECRLISRLNPGPLFDGTHTRNPGVGLYESFSHSATTSKNLLRHHFSWQMILNLD
jgi:hypothetical protein